jgi:hypothetical protein
MHWKTEMKIRGLLQWVGAVSFALTGVIILALTTKLLTDEITNDTKESTIKQLEENSDGWRRLYRQCEQEHGR